MSHTFQGGVGGPKSINRTEPTNPSHAIYFFVTQVDGPCSKNLSEILPSILGCQKNAYIFFNINFFDLSDNLTCFLSRKYNMLAKYYCEALNLTL